LLRVYLKNPTIKRLSFQTHGAPGFSLEGGGPAEYSYVRITDDNVTLGFFSPADFSFAVVDDERLQIEEVIPLLGQIKDAIEKYENPEATTPDKDE
jgi:hypothetical protein